MTRAEVTIIWERVSREGMPKVDDVMDLKAEVERWHDMVVELNDCTHWKDVETALREWEDE